MHENKNKISGSSVEFVIDKTKPVHIIGGGGVGMSALARLLIHSGFTVSASDKNGGKYLQNLAEAGATTWVGSQPHQVPKDAVIFYSSAIPESDPERLWAVENKVPAYPRHVLLETITQQYYTIAVSGTHGKTTTTAWIAYILELAGMNPSALIGGTMVQWHSNVKLGAGTINDKPILVIEADESDESFLFIKASELIVTNIDLDHVDHYSDLDQVKEKFRQCIDKCQKSGGLFFPSYEVRDLMDSSMNSWEKIHTIVDQISIDEKSHGLLWTSGNLQNSTMLFEVGLLGAHNLWNAFAVLVFALYHGLAIASIHSAMTNFRGVERRMQKLGKYTNRNGANVIVVDDYAHHPTEIKMVLNTFKEKYDHTIVVWEPHRVSRMIYFNSDFQNVFESTIESKNLFLMDIYDAAGERSLPEFAAFNEIWQQWNSKAHGVISKLGEYKELNAHIDSLNRNMAVVFLGAGHSSEYASHFFEFTKPN